MTLVEVLVAMFLMLFVGAVVLTALVNLQQVFRTNSGEARGLADVRTVVERLGRDIRDAKGVETGATSSQLTLWVDYNSNYRRDISSEIITWKIVNPSGGSCAAVGHCNVVRTVNAVDTVVAATIVQDIGFSYDQAAPASRLVSVNMTYNAAAAGSGSGSRTVSFQDRLRNVE